MLISGWKTVSMMDVRGSITFTLWLCGCNLRCPFCHNWKIASGIGCVKLDDAKFFDDLKESMPLIDYLHITGGEPLLQWRELRFLLKRVKKLGVSVSLNTNGTFVKPLEKLVKEGLVDHVATDLKTPLLYGMSQRSSMKLWELFVKTLDLISEYQLPLELRIPIARRLNMEEFLSYVDSALSHLKAHPDFYIIINPLLGPPLVLPRDRAWCLSHCFPEKEIEIVIDYLERKGVNYSSLMDGAL